MGGHRQIGAWSFEDVVAINTEEIFIEVAMERPSLRVELIVASSLGHCKSALIFTALRAIGVPVFTSGTFLISFAVPRRAVDADVEDRTTPERREGDLLGEGFGVCQAVSDRSRSESGRRRTKVSRADSAAERQSTSFRPTRSIDLIRSSLLMCLLW